MHTVHTTDRGVAEVLHLYGAFEQCRGPDVCDRFLADERDGRIPLAEGWKRAQVRVQTDELSESAPLAMGYLVLHQHYVLFIFNRHA